MDEALKTLLEREGYSHIREISNRGVCAIMRFAFTTAIVMGIDEFQYYGRWCFHTKREAVKALEEWDGIEDPSGEWIKYKGRGGERSRIPNFWEIEESQAKLQLEQSN